MDFNSCDFVRRPATGTYFSSFFWKKQIPRCTRDDKPKEPLASRVGGLCQGGWLRWRSNGSGHFAQAFA
jgi:hypothetical protein